MNKTLTLPVTLGRQSDPAAPVAEPAVDPAADAVDETEARMRRALGLEGRARRASPFAGRVEEKGFGPGRARRRFVPEKEATAAPDGHLAEALATERAAREHAEQALRHAQETIRDLQTKLGHAELARDEAVATLHARVGPPPVPAKPARPVRSAKPREPQPVKWWLSPGAKATQKKKRDA